MVVSPTSLNLALATVCAGTEGPTRDQLRDLLRHRLLGSDLNDRKIHALYRPFSATLRNLEDTAGLKFATALWMDRSALKSQGDNLDAFGRQMEEVFGTELYDREGGAAINDWAHLSTSQMINRMVPEDDEEVAAPLLVTAVTAVKAMWTTPFDSKKTWPGEFVNDNGEPSMCHMMHQKGRFMCAYLQNTRALTVPCGVDGETAVTFMIPNFGSIDDFANDFTAEQWQAVCRSLVPEDVRLFLPRFKVEGSNCSLKSELLASGVADVFSEDDADFSRLGEAGVFWVEDVIGKSLFHADEDGAKPLDPAEGGLFSFSCVGSGTEFRLDRPFMFVCHRGDAITLVGKVTEPIDIPFTSIEG